MTKLNEGQQELVSELELEREHVAGLDAQALADFERRKSKNRYRLRKLAAAAYQAGVPIRRIGNAINTSDFRTVKSLIEEGYDSDEANREGGVRGTH